MVPYEFVQRYQIHILICLHYLVCDFKMAFNPIVGSIYHNSAIKIPNVVKQVQVVQTIFFTLMIIVDLKLDHYHLHQWFFWIKFAFLCLLHICRNACAKAELCKNNKNVPLWWKRIKMNKKILKLKRQFEFKQVSWLNIWNPF